jgi:hypothetical protein
MPKGWPVEVTFAYGANGRLSVHAQVPGTHHQAKLDLERDVGLSGAGLARWKMPISTAAGFGAFEAAAVDVKASNVAPGGEAFPRGGAVPGGPQTAAPMATPPGAAPSFSGFAAAPVAPVAAPPGFASAPVAPVAPMATVAMPYGATGFSAPAAAPIAVPQQFGAIPMPSAAGADALAAANMQGTLPMPAGSGSPQFDAIGTSRPAQSPAEPAQVSRSISRIKPPAFMKTPLGRIIGHIITSALGFACSYALLRHFRPDLFRWPPW